MSGLSEHEIGAFADVFPDPFSARHVLATAGVPTRRHPSWTATDAYGFWGAVSVLLTNGLVKDGPARLFAAALALFPANPVFLASAAARSAGPAMPTLPGTTPSRPDSTISSPTNPDVLKDPAEPLQLGLRLAERRRTLGHDHPDALADAHLLAYGLIVFGDYQAARALAEDTLTRRRHTLGHDHPDT
ncbi:effector-associated domain EAD1-containing protein, partial [Pseudofrankia sp. EUN1h]|uniref:effector-associated domain EAD1-containing protein n=2 Tax=Pseudofrankia TaxID=2994363 RepID=UPI000A6FD0C8